MRLARRSKWWNIWEAWERWIGRPRSKQAARNGQAGDWGSRARRRGRGLGSAHWVFRPAWYRGRTAPLRGLRAAEAVSLSAGRWRGGWGKRWRKRGARLISAPLRRGGGSCRGPSGEQTDLLVVLSSLPYLLPKFCLLHRPSRELYRCAPPLLKNATNAQKPN